MSSKIINDISNETWYNEKTARTTKDPEILRKILEKGKDDWVSQCAARNPSTSPQSLAEILSRGKDDWVSQYAARNPSTPPQLLSEILNRGKDDGVSYCAARNPSYINWMRKLEEEYINANKKWKFVTPIDYLEL